MSSCFLQWVDQTVRILQMRFRFRSASTWFDSIWV